MGEVDQMVNSANMDIASALDRDGPRVYKPSGLHRYGTPKWHRQVVRYCEILTELQYGITFHEAEALGLAQQLGRDLEDDILDQGLDPGEITRAAFRATRTATCRR